MNRKLQASKYIIFDLISAASAWSTFFFYRKTYVESQKFGYKVMVHINEQFLWGLLLIPFFWMLIYALLGTYSNVYRKSRLKELSQTFTTTILGVTGLFFALILDDEVLNYTTYYQSYAVLFGFPASLQAKFTVEKLVFQH
jgi:hypothetical protein